MRSGGSVFSVTVPTAKAINYTAAVTTATPLSRTPMSGSLIVCIENDPAILDGMKTLLTAWDAEVIAVADPDAAIEAIGAAGRGVTGLLVDYHLDRGNGVAAIREIRRRFGENIPAILITRTAARSAAARGHRVLNKPVKPASLARGGGGENMAVLKKRAEKKESRCALARSMAHAADGGGGVIGISRLGRCGIRRAIRGYCADGVSCRHWPPAIFAAAITAWVRLSTPSFCRIADTCALMVASETPSS